MQVTSKSGAAIGQIMTYGLNRVRSARRREDIEQAMEESLMEVMPRLEKRTHYLATFANMATLMGLLGTIIGLIDAFTAVSNANPAEKAELLSAQHLDRHELHGVRPDGRDSARARCTRCCRRRRPQIVDSLEMASVKFLNAITERAQDGKPAEAVAAAPAPAPRRG